MAALLTVQFNTDDTIKSQKSVALMVFLLPRYLKKKMINKNCVLKSTPPSTLLNIR